MKKNIGRLICGALVVAMSVTVFTGCSKESSKESKKAESSQSGKNTFAYSDDDSETPTSTTITGTVSDVDGDEVTLSIGGGMGGNPPEKPSGDDSDAGPMGGESKEAVLTIGDESIITVVDDDNNETQGSLDDLTKGTSVSITFDETGEITSIKVGNVSNGGPGGQGGPGEQSGGVDSYEAVTEYSEDTSANDETYAGDGGAGYCNVYVSKDSKWVVTGDSTVTSLYSEGTIVDEDGKTVTIVGDDGTKYVTGDSQYTITVEKYDTSADFTNASKSSSWSDYETAKPEELK